MFERKTEANVNGEHVHHALLDHRNHIEHASTRSKALQTGLNQHTELMQKLHTQARDLQKQLDAAKHSMHSHETGLKAHTQILDDVHEGMMNHTGALNSISDRVKMSDYKLMQTESRLSATLAQIQDSLEEVENAVITHANILDNHQTRLQQEPTACQYTVVPDVMSMAPRRR